MSSPPPWVKDGRFSVTSPTNSLDTAHSSTPSLDHARSAFSPVADSSVAAQIPLTEHTAVAPASSSENTSASGAASSVGQGQAKRSPKDHWLILPDFDISQYPVGGRKGQRQSQKSKEQDKQSGVEAGESEKMETEFPVDNASPKRIYSSKSNAGSSDVCDTSKEDKNKSNMMEEKLTKDQKEKESLRVKKEKGSTDDVSPGQELLKLADSFSEKYIVDKNDDLPHIKPQAAGPSGQPSTHQGAKGQRVPQLDSDSEESDSNAGLSAHDFSCASTVSLNELLEKELDELETPLDEEFSVNNLPIYMVEDISIDDLEDVVDPQEIYDQCVVERKFEIKDGVLVARNVAKEEVGAKEQSNNNSCLKNHNQKSGGCGTASPERPSSLKLGNGSDAGCSGCHRSGSHVNNGNKGDTGKRENHPPKPSACVEKLCKNGLLNSANGSGDVTPVMVASNHSNTSSSPDSAMQGSFTSTSSSDVSGVPDRVAQRTDDGYASNSTVSLNEIQNKDVGAASCTSVETRSDLSTPQSEVTSVNSVISCGAATPKRSRERSESQCSEASTASNGRGKVKDMRAYFEQRVEEITQEVTRRRASGSNQRDSSEPRLREPHSITNDAKYSVENTDTATLIYSPSEGAVMSGSLVKKNNSSLESSEMSNSQKTLTPQDSDFKSPLTSPKRQSSCTAAKQSKSGGWVSSDDLDLVRKVKFRADRTLKHSLSDSNIARGRLLDCPGYLKSLHSQLARIYCLAESLKVCTVVLHVVAQ